MSTSARHRRDLVVKATMAIAALHAPYARASTRQGRTRPLIGSRRIARLGRFGAGMDVADDLAKAGPARRAGDPNVDHAT